MPDLRRAAVVTGAGRGIGRALALELARLGHPLALQARTASQLFETVREVEALGGRAIAVPGDVTDPASAKALVEACAAKLGPLAIAVACAGQALSAPLLRTKAEDLRALLEVKERVHCRTRS